MMMVEMLLGHVSCCKSEFKSNDRMHAEGVHTFLDAPTSNTRLFRGIF